MRNVIPAMRDFIRDEEGQDIIEYGLLATFIAIVAALLLILFKDPIQNIYQGILDHLNVANTNLPSTP
jgi:Flp pilus assembly pilin Flp